MSAAPSYQSIKPLPAWTDEERPRVPGSPSTPQHPLQIRFAFGCVGILVGITSGLGMSLINLNLPSIQGDMALTPAQAAYFPAVYATGNACANLIIFKFRQQYGIRLFAEIALVLYVLLALLHLLVNDYGTALLVRAVSGFSGAAMAVLAFYYMLQAFNKRHRAKGLIIGIGISQLATPLAGVFSPVLIPNGQWHVLYQFEAGLALCSLAAVVVLKLPPSIHIRAFEKQDVWTVVMMIPGIGLLFAALSLGVIQWWTNAPWIGYALCASLLLIVFVLFYEHHRANPLIQTRWFLHPATINFALGALVLRFLISEQNVGAVSMLKLLGMGADQLQGFYLVVLGGVVLGIAASALLFHAKTILLQIFAALALIAVAAFMDSQSTSLTRPHDMFVSQFMLSVAAGLFLGPMMLMGIMQAFRQGAHTMITFAILFSFTQNFAGIAGQAFFGTYQIVREHEYVASISADIASTASQTAARLQKETALYSPLTTDPALRQAYGLAHLGEAVRREANTRAYNDVFILAGSIAAFFLLWSLLNILLAFKSARRMLRMTRLRRKLIVHVIRYRQKSTGGTGSRSRRGRPGAGTCAAGNP